MAATENQWRFPVFTSLQGYRPDWLRSDASGGLAIAAVGLPSAIAYPAIAGLPPETGLYASIAPAGRLRHFRPVAAADRWAGRGDDDGAGRGALATISPPRRA